MSSLVSASRVCETLSGSDAYHHGTCTLSGVVRVCAAQLAETSSDRSHTRINGEWPAYLKGQVELEAHQGLVVAEFSEGGCMGLRLYSIGDDQKPIQISESNEIVISNGVSR